MFLFLLLLFNSSDSKSQEDTLSHGYKIHFMSVLEQYLLFNAERNEALTAIRLGNANELAILLQEL